MSFKENEKLTIIYFGDVWDTFWRRRQQIAFRLSRLAWVKRLIYVEFPLTLSSLPRFLVKNADYSASKRWPQVFGSGFVRKYNYKLIVITPLIPISYFRFHGSCANWIRRFNELCQVALLNAWLGHCQCCQRVLWISHPILTAGFINRFKENCLCYDSTEDIVLNVEQRLSQAISQSISAEDRLLARKADVIFTNSSVLFESYGKVNPNVRLLLNAVELSHFDSLVARPKPDDMLHIPSPLAGYIGTLNVTTDLELLDYLTTLRPEWSFVLLAANALEDLAAKKLFQRIVQYPNVFYLGEKSYQELPAYIQHFDVGLRLYKVNELTRSGTSLTTIYFLASGKPVVATDTAGVEHFQDAVFVAHSREEYVGLIARALQQDREKWLGHALAVARPHSWEDRISKVEKAVLEALEGKSNGYANRY